MESKSRSSHVEVTQEASNVCILSLTAGQIKVESSQKEQELLQNLFDWRERSEKTQWILGEPLNY